MTCTSAAVIVITAVVVILLLNSSGGGSWGILGAAAFSTSSFVVQQQQPPLSRLRRSLGIHGRAVAVVIGQQHRTDDREIHAGRRRKLRLPAQHDTDVHVHSSANDGFATSSSSSSSSWNVADDWTALSAADAMIVSSPPPSSSASMSWEENTSGGGIIVLPRVMTEKWQDYTTTTTHSNDGDNYNDGHERIIKDENHSNGGAVAGFIVDDDDDDKKHSTSEDDNDAINDFAELAIETILTNSYFDDGIGGLQLYNTASTTSPSSSAAATTTATATETPMMDNYNNNNINEEEEEEIAYMIRCNASPKQLLISQGKALPELTDVMKYNPMFLLREDKTIDEDTKDSTMYADRTGSGSLVILQNPLLPVATPFFLSAIETIFNAYADNEVGDWRKMFVGNAGTKAPTTLEMKKVLDRSGLARWMTKCISSPLASSSATSATASSSSSPKSSQTTTITFGPYDPNISLLLSRYSTIHGSGQLTLSEFQTLYLEIAWAGYIRDVTQKKILVTKDANQYYRKITFSQSASSSTTIDGGDVGVVIVTGRKNTEKLLKHASLSLVWRDLEAHGIFSPAEEERVQLLLEMERAMKDSLHQTMPSQSSASFLMDECELLDDYEERLLRRHDSMSNEDNDNDVLGVENAWNFLKEDGRKEARKREKSSHEMVEMASDGKTPRRIRDGQFVFIDEETCIGCSQVRKMTALV